MNNYYVWNYTSLKQRESKIYNVGGYNIAGGFSVEFLKVVGPVTLGLILIFALFGNFVLGLSYIKVLDPNFSPKYTIFTIIISLVIGCALWYIKFDGYRLYQYLTAYYKPKKIYRFAFKEKEVVFTNIKINATVRSIL